MASVGDWTHALYQIVSDPVMRERTVVQVQGPFAAPAKWAASVTTEPTLLVASGIGITPFFSLMATKVSLFSLFRSSPSCSDRYFIYLKCFYFVQVADELNFQSDKEVYQELFLEEVSQRRRSVRYVIIVVYRKWTSVMHVFLSVYCDFFDIFCPLFFFSRSAR